MNRVSLKYAGGRLALLAAISWCAMAVLASGQEAKDAKKPADAKKAADAKSAQAKPGDKPATAKTDSKKPGANQGADAKNPKKKKGGGKPPEKASSNASSSGSNEAGGDVSGESEFEAMNKVATAIRESLEVGPTLVVWLFDRTPSALRLTREMAARVQVFYDSADIQEISHDESQPLLTAVATFDDKVEFALDPPTADPGKVQTTFGALKQTQAGREKPFGAIKQALDKYARLRTEQRREVLIVLVTDEAGDDAAIADEVIPRLRKSAIPVYVVGYAAPWGQANPLAPNTKTIDPNRRDDNLPTAGPESLRSERVEIQATGDKSLETELVDSGFGPFAMERVCRASHGLFIAVRGGEGLTGAAKSWPNGKELRFDPGVAAKYAPEYITEAEYDKLNAANKARGAVIEAAKLNKLVLDGSPVTRFPKDVEAKMAKQSNQAQQYAARNTPEVDQFFEILSKGEGDREKLSSPRWRAEYDLAMGRVMAIKVRLDGYNSMIAALKRGKTFANASSQAWVLTPADAFETESTLKKMGERAKMYLERVVKEHPGTPWAKIAAQELKTPLGWTWKES